MRELYNSYVKGDCDLVWKEIRFRDYRELTEVERKAIDAVLKEALTRIDSNFRMVYKALREFGYRYENIANLNTTNQHYILRNLSEYSIQIEKFYEHDDPELNVPLFFSAFCSFFKVVDFRGYFNFDVPLFLDPFFVESFNNRSEIAELIFERDFDGSTVQCCMFSPDEYNKEGESGDLGPCILMSSGISIDNYVVNFQDDLKFTFIEYLRFCFHWACLPSLYWASEDEQKPFSPLLTHVREQTKIF